MANAMGDQYGINLGNIMRTGMQIQDFNDRRQANAMAAQEKKDARGFMQAFIEAETPEDQRAAYNSLVTLDPDAAEKFIMSYDKMEERDRMEMKRRNSRVGKYAHMISQAENPEQGCWSQ